VLRWPPLRCRIGENMTALTVWHLEKNRRDGAANGRTRPGSLQCRHYIAFACFSAKSPITGSLYI
jgi:hypothetical protein